MLTASEGRPEDAKRLAARAFLKASYEVRDEETKGAYRDLAKKALRHQTTHPNTDRQLTLDDLEQAFKVELAGAEEWYAKLRENEISWIRGGKDPEAEFDRLYF